MAELAVESGAPAAAEPPAETWSIAAIASAVCGVFLIVPYLSALAALGLGILGLRQTAGAEMRGSAGEDTSGTTDSAGEGTGGTTDSAGEDTGGTRGRRLAWVGVMLGLLNILGWSVYFWIVADLSAGGRAAANRFFADLNSGASEWASRDCIGVPPARLDAAAEEIKGWGGVKSVTVLSITSDSTNGASAGAVRGELRTPGGKHLFQLRTRDWKVADFSIQ
jgi:hypothetical protein